MEKNIKINRFGIYYIPRKVLEDNIPNKLSALKKKRSKLIKKNESVKDIDEALKKLSSKRPCIIIKAYKGNVTLMPITKSSADESHFKTNSFPNNKFDSYVKISNIITMNKNKFLKLMQRNGNIRMPKEEREIFLEEIKQHYFK